jgi:cyclase
MKTTISKIENTRWVKVAYEPEEQHEFLLNTFIVLGEKHNFLLDTGFGPESLQPALQWLRDNSPGKPLVAFNSHHHWDHVWGNAALEGVDIIATEECAKEMSLSGEYYLEKNNKWLQGESSLRIPNRTFTDELRYPEDGLFFFASPGHTIDSASCFDEKEQVLFVADNIERPLLQLDCPIENLPACETTLRRYLDFAPKMYLSSHDVEITKDDVLEHLEYIQSFKAKAPDEVSVSDTLQKNHIYNLRLLLFASYKEQVMKTRGWNLERYNEYCESIYKKSYKEVERELKG